VSNPNVVRIDEKTYEWFKYPGGELQVRLKPETIESLSSCFGIVVIHPIKNSDDVMKLLLLQDAINDITLSMPSNNMAVVIPYLPYSRADRRFVEGDCLGKKVFLNIITCVWPYAKIYTLDCHSNRFYYEYRDILVEKIIQDILVNDPEANIIFPDKGAQNRYADMLSGDHPKYYCEKKRDPVTGKFLGFEVPVIKDTTRNSYIIDDICDGGGTFLGIAEKLQIPNLRLFVTHGIFSKGFDDLSKYFDKIYTTNSFTEPCISDKVEVIDVIDWMVEIAEEELIGLYV
jgi:ribose-phosphate pyrophosphokinase